MTRTKKLTLAAVFVAIAVILKVVTTLFFAGISKFSLTFIPNVLGAAVLGPVLGAVIGAAADVIGFFIQQDGTYFFGFTLNAIIKGMIYGLFLFKKPKKLASISFAVVLSTLVTDLALSTIWVHMLYGLDVRVVLASKAATLPVYAAGQIVVMKLLFRYLDKEIGKLTE